LIRRQRNSSNALYVMAGIVFLVFIMSVKAYLLLKPQTTPKKIKKVLDAQKSESKAPLKAPKGTGVRGIVLSDKGKPIKNAVVSVYTKPGSDIKSVKRPGGASTNLPGLAGGGTPGNILRGPSDFQSAPTNSNGQYIVDLPSGTFYMIARFRQNNRQNIGPLSKGDLYSLTSNEAVKTKGKGYKKLNFKLKVFTGLTSLFNFPQTTSRTVIKGIIVDEKNKPLKNAVVLAYKQRDVRGRPDYASDWTGADGKFVVYLPQGGRYYLTGRVKIIGPPQEGELFGVYRGGDDHSVFVEDNKFTENITMALQPFTPKIIERLGLSNDAPGKSYYQENKKALETQEDK